MKNKLKILVNIPFLACLTLLLLNDFYLKAEYHNWLTGKLSDFCGLFIFASLWTALFPNKKKSIYFSTALFFVIWKSPYSQSFIDLFNQILYPIQRVVDITDLVALIILPIGFYYKPDLYIRLKINPIPLALLTLFSFCATSIPQPGQVFEQPQYLLFKSGITVLESSDYPSEYEVHNLDTLVIVDVKSIRIDKRATIDDEYHKVQILNNIDLRLLREIREGYRAKIKLKDYQSLRDSLTEDGTTSITLNLDTFTDELNFRKTRLNGSFKRYSDDNQLTIEGSYQNGIEDSIWTFFNNQNEIISRKYFENGELIQTEIFERSLLISEKKFKTRNKAISDQYFYLAILFVLIISLILKLYFNFKRSEDRDIIQLSNFSKIAMSLILPIGVYILAKVFSTLIPNSYSPFLLDIIGEAFLVYILTTPIFLLILYFLKLRNRFDLIYYFLLLSLTIVLAEEWSYLKGMI